MHLLDTFPVYIAYTPLAGHYFDFEKKPSEWGIKTDFISLFNAEMFSAIVMHTLTHSFTHW